MRRPRLVVPVLATAVAALILARGPAAADRRPDIVVGVGHTATVAGEPNGGGMSFALSLLWRLDDHFRVGMMGFAEDLGGRTERLEGPRGEDLGPISEFNRATRGAAWRMEGHMPSHGFVTPYFAATWGFYRLDDDLRGDVFQRVYAAGFGLGAGLLRAINDRHSAGAAVRFQKLSRGSSDHYLSASLEWRWGRGATE